MIIEHNAADADLLEFYHTLQQFIRQHDHSLTIRQLAVFLTCYLLEEEHTVRRLAARFGTAKPAVSRMLDHLVQEGLLERCADPRDRRSVLFGRTTVGTLFLERMRRPGARNSRAIPGWLHGASESSRE